MKKRYWRLLKTLIKVIITGIALYWVFSKINFSEVFVIIKKSKLFELILAVLLFAASKVIASLRLNIIFKSSKIDIDYIDNLKLYWLGMFYNLFLPGGIGGDGYKIYLINKNKNRSVKSVFGAVLVDRLVGVLALIVLVTLVVPFLEEELMPLQNWSFILPLFFLIGFYCLLHILCKHYIEIYPSIFIYSLGVQILQLICAFFILMALGFNENIAEYLFLFLISSVVAILPFTIGGVGAREFTFLIGSNYLALQPEISIALSLSFYLITAIVSFIGIIWVIKPLKLK